MLDRIRGDESLQVLVFIVLPLLLLFIGVMILWFRNRRPSSAQFATFTISISREGHEDAYILYREQGKRLEFYAGRCTGKKVHLQAPKEMSEEEIREFVPNLALGLRKLGFKEYWIWKEGGTQAIARSGSQDRDSAES